MDGPLNLGIDASVLIVIAAVDEFVFPLIMVRVMNFSVRCDITFRVSFTSGLHNLSFNPLEHFRCNRDTIAIRPCVVKLWDVECALGLGKALHVNELFLVGRACR